MSTQQSNECIHDSPNKKIVHAEHDQAGTLPVVSLCPDCIVFYKDSTHYKLTFESPPDDITKQSLEASKN